MTLPIRTCEPTQIAEGEKISWQRTFADFGASLYDLEYRFREIGGSGHADIAAMASGDTFVAAITSTVSTGLAAGRYRWQAWLTDKSDATNTWIEQSGFLTVEAGSTHHGTETVAKSMAKQSVDAIDAALMVSSGDGIEYEVSTPAGTNRVKRSRTEAIAIRQEYAKIVASEYARERAREGKSVGTQYKIRMFDNN